MKHSVVEYGHRIDRAVEKLASVKARKGMYFGDTVRDGETFLQGFRQALIATGVPVTIHSQAVLESRGWQFTSVGFAPSMREKRLTEAEIMDELIDALVVELRQLSDLSLTERSMA